MGLQRGFIDKSKGYNGPQIGSEGWDKPMGGSMGDLMGNPISEPIGDSMGEPIGNSMGDSMGNSMPIDRFCSFYNQKKPLIDFGRFLTYNPCRQRNRKANQARYLKQRALLNNKSSSSSS
jgi:hypothetical protein